MGNRVLIIGKRFHSRLRVIFNVLLVPGLDFDNHLITMILLIKSVRGMIF
jgi:hypothetical protein